MATNAFSAGPFTIHLNHFNCSRRMLSAMSGAGVDKASMTSLHRTSLHLNSFEGESFRWNFPLAPVVCAVHASCTAQYTHSDNLKQGMRPSTHGHLPSQPNPTQLSNPLHRRILSHGRSRELSWHALALGSCRFRIKYEVAAAYSTFPFGRRPVLLSLICEVSIFVASLSVSASFIFPITHHVFPFNQP